jgi:hypothetical protein
VAKEGILAGRILARGLGLGFAQVVQQRGHAHDEIRHRRVDGGQDVLIDVMLVKAVLNAADGGQHLGQDLGKQPGRAHEIEPNRRLGRQKQLAQLIADALGRNLAKRIECEGNCGLGIRIECKTQLGSLANGAHGTQTVLGETQNGIAHGSHDLACDVALAVEGIDERARHRIEGDGVHGEIPARQILVECGPKGHRRWPAAVEVGALTAKGRHLDVTLRGRLAGQNSHGAVLKSCRNRVARAEDAHGRLGQARWWPRRNRQARGR